MRGLEWDHDLGFTTRRLRFTTVTVKAEPAFAFSRLRASVARPDVPVLAMAPGSAGLALGPRPQAVAFAGVLVLAGLFGAALGRAGGEVLDQRPAISGSPGE